MANIFHWYVKFCNGDVDDGQVDEPIMCLKILTTLKSLAIFGSKSSTSISGNYNVSPVCWTLNYAKSHLSTKYSNIIGQFLASG